MKSSVVCYTERIWYLNGFSFWDYCDSVNTLNTKQSIVKPTLIKDILTDYENESFKYYAIHLAVYALLQMSNH